PLGKLRLRPNISWRRPSRPGALRYNAELFQLNCFDPLRTVEIGKDRDCPKPVRFDAHAVLSIIISSAQVQRRLNSQHGVTGRLTEAGGYADSVGPPEDGLPDWNRSGCIVRHPEKSHLPIAWQADQSSFIIGAREASDTRAGQVSPPKWRTVTSRSFENPYFPPRGINDLGF